jgi:hypothetical protein
VAVPGAEDVDDAEAVGVPAPPDVLGAELDGAVDCGLGVGAAPGSAEEHAVAVAARTRAVASEGSKAARRIPPLSCMRSSSWCWPYYYAIRPKLVPSVRRVA